MRPRDAKYQHEQNRGRHAVQEIDLQRLYLDIEMALLSHGTAELQALDDLTPRATGLVTPTP